MNLETLAIAADPGRTFRPESANHSEPFFKLGAKPSRARILDTPELIRKSEGAEQWNLFIVTRCETAIAKPDKEVPYAGSRMQDPPGSNFCTVRRQPGFENPTCASPHLDWPGAGVVKFRLLQIKPP
jgi:hypothetical protein